MLVKLQHKIQRVRSDNVLLVCISDDCKKGCKGPLLHPLHHFGVLGPCFTGPRAETAGNSGSKQYKQSK